MHFLFSFYAHLYIYTHTNTATHTHTHTDTRTPAGGDPWSTIARSNEAAFAGDTRTQTTDRQTQAQPKKKAPEKRGPSLYRVLSDYVNLENFDPNKPPDVQEMINGMLELTGQKEDVGGEYIHTHTHTHTPTCIHGFLSALY
jgi:hypothetical protein